MSRNTLLLLLTLTVAISPMVDAQVIKWPMKTTRPDGTVEKAWFKHDRCVGVWKYYDSSGKLIKTIDWERGTKSYHNGYNELWDGVFQFIKDRSDSLVRTHFGSAFMAANIHWNPEVCSFHAKGTGFDWFDPTRSEPERFLMRYDVRFGDRWYPEMIEFELDRQGHVIDLWEEDVLGLTDKCTPEGCSFQVTERSGKRIARENGLGKNKGRYIQYLDWHRLDTTCGQWLGEYEWVVARLRSKVRSLNETTWSYDGVVIDPWSGTFKKRITLRSHSIVERYAAVSSGLIRDDR